MEFQALECKNCGAPLNKDSLKCEYCGTEYQTKIIESSMDKTLTEKIRSSKLWSFIGVIILCICIFCILFNVLLLSKNTKTEESISTEDVVSSMQQQLNDFEEETKNSLEQRKDAIAESNSVVQSDIKVSPERDADKAASEELYEHDDNTELVSELLDGMVFISIKAIIGVIILFIVYLALIIYVRILFHR